MKKSLVLMLMLAATVFLLAACGSTNNSSKKGGVEVTGEAATKEIVITATRYKFDQPVYKIKKGEVTKITLDSPDGIHGIIIPDLDQTIDADKPTVVKIDKAGEYEFKCSIMCGTGHSKMVAKLVVE
ncbi:hypothetical protein Back11_62640 [Paenibacillus baekrokdamisoli]|uniref:Uncharacterized protein n=1 Tax=Paenibacillus baekrokdamisoli TaxID=1712516 RepID=A0A3G9JPD5_9BACL|nr:cupredoxin domain-containing protein [Paenibacillus baekrokdamisoli]MBB3069507.1 cytochrome c oxidase subunit 2 [Paenibacillus baekrokdamisoli]BBH24919.1 hypothetical protein Back11_62640 [Paenibacillus baekrokdamisoli]